MIRTCVGATLAAFLVAALSGCQPGSEPATSDAPALPVMTVSNVSSVASLSASCSGCHASGQAIVSLNQFSAEAIATSLQRYRTEDGTTVMHRMARGFTEAQINDIAAYLADEAAP